MRISIALATYNASLYLPELLDSILAQTRLPDEMIITDDASVDNTIAMLHDFAKSAPFKVRVERNERNLGIARNFQKGLEMCNGDIIALCDADDIWYPQRLQRAQEALLSYKEIGLVFSDGDIIDENGNRIIGTLWSRSGLNEKKLDAFKKDPFKTLLRGPIMTGPTMTFRSQFLKGWLPIGDNWFQDAWIALVASCNTKIMPIRERLIAYRRHENQQTASSAECHQQKVSNIERRERLLEAVNRYEEFRDFISNWPQDVARDNIVLAVNGKIEHLRARACVYEQPFLSVLIVLRELFSCRYHKYSTLGFKGAIKDLIRQDVPAKRHY